MKCGHSNKIAAEELVGVLDATPKRETPAEGSKQKLRHRKIGLYAGGFGALALLGAMLAIRSKA